jgi:hypothetical protein
VRSCILCVFSQTRPRYPCSGSFHPHGDTQMHVLARSQLRAWGVLCWTCVCCTSFAHRLSLIAVPRTRVCFVHSSLRKCGMHPCTTHAHTDLPAQRGDGHTASVEPRSFALAFHGGAGIIPRNIDSAPYLTALRRICAEARAVAEDAASTRTEIDFGAAALHVVEEVVKMLEDEPLFNAGRGSVFTNKGVSDCIRMRTTRNTLSLRCCARRHTSSRRRL